MEELDCRIQVIRGIGDYESEVEELGDSAVIKGIDDKKGKSKGDRNGEVWDKGISDNALGK